MDNTRNQFWSGMAVVVLFGAGLVSCQKATVPGPADSSSGNPNTKTTTNLVQGPPVITWWSTGDSIPYTAYLPSDPPVSMWYSVGFAINGKGFVLGGMLNTQSGQADHVPALWMFDPAAQAWDSMARYPGNYGGLVGEAVFVIGDNAYVVQDNAVWQYNQPTNHWTAKGNFPGAARFWGTGMAINGKGYFGLGVNDHTIEDMVNWWQYDPTTDHWTRMADFGGAARDQAAGFAIGGKGYVCLGEATTGSDYSTVWQYDPVANSWDQKKSLTGLSGGGSVAVNATIGGVDLGLLVGGGHLWAYNPAINSWYDEGTSANVGSGGALPPAAFVIGNSFCIAHIAMASYNWTR
jgi:N-acetylneuraminic acid mutarotase